MNPHRPVAFAACAEPLGSRQHRCAEWVRIDLEGFTNSSVFGCGSLPVISETLLRLSWFRKSVAGRIFREAILENSGLDWDHCPCSTFDSRRFPKLSQSRRRHTQNGFSRCPAKRLRPSCSTQLSNRNISTKACALRKNDRTPCLPLT